MFSKEHVLKIVSKLDKKSEMIQLPTMRGNEGKNKVYEGNLQNIISGKSRK